MHPQQRGLLVLICDPPLPVELAEDVISGEGELEKGVVDQRECETQSRSGTSEDREKYVVKRFKGFLSCPMGGKDCKYTYCMRILQQHIQDHHCKKYPHRRGKPRGKFRVTYTSGPLPPELLLPPTAPEADDEMPSPKTPSIALDDEDDFIPTITRDEDTQGTPINARTPLPETPPSTIPFVVGDGLTFQESPVKRMPWLPDGLGLLQASPINPRIAPTDFFDNLFPGPLPNRTLSPELPEQFDSGVDLGNSPVDLSSSALETISHDGPAVQQNDCPDCGAGPLTAEHMRTHSLSVIGNYTYNKRKAHPILYRMKETLLFRCNCDAELVSVAAAREHLAEIKRAVEAKEPIAHSHNYKHLATGKL
ncbi:hypothetical protein B0H15DRAFT_803372 [Mycena belliarum]|uniref:Uncharacterized protein n=1 Tax=Mycena belliarum TaxID=1033014 RepID=A0AAD6XNK5_9AGAR|nr:hypothetical protein B0H15DRAFT_803372 [Mycena belliae]